MINKIFSTKDGIEIGAIDGREFNLSVKDFPVPKNEGDRVEVEQLIEKQIRDVFPDAVIKIHIYRLDPILCRATLFGQEPPEDWWL